MDQIQIRKLRFYGYHGWHQEESRLGQAFIINLLLHLDLRQAGQSDTIRDTVDYSKVIALTRGIVEGEPCKLIEAVAERISAELLENFPQVQSLEVEIIKPNPPLPTPSDGVSVRILRSRSDYTSG